MSGYILSIDQGTTSSRAIVFDSNAVIKGVGQKDLQLFYPDNGWVEQDANAIWHDTVEICHKAISVAGIAVTEIAAIGVTNQRETTVVWDRKTGDPVCNAIVWQDRRTAGFCEELRAAGHEDMIRSKTGLLIDPYFSATKLKWLLDHVDGLRDRVGNLCFGTVDSYLLFKLTDGKVHATDATNASRTLLYNIVDGCWDDELLKLFDIPGSLLPEIKDNAADFGMCSVFGADIPVTGMAGDQHAALIGQACFAPGMVKSTYGTGCFMLMNIGETFVESKNHLLTTIGYQLDGKVTYAIEGAIFNAGTVIQWLRDELEIISDAVETQALAESVCDNGGVYFVPAFTGLGAPYWNPQARGLITGITRDTRKAHIIRAALEAQAYQTHDLVAAMREDTGQDLSTLRVDGGMVANNFMCQFLANILGVAVDRPKVIETTALGAAYLAGLQVGVFHSLEDISNRWAKNRSFQPSGAETTELISGWNRAIGQVLSTPGKN